MNSIINLKQKDIETKHKNLMKNHLAKTKKKCNLIKIITVIIKLKKP